LMPVGNGYRAPTGTQKSAQDGVIVRFQRDGLTIHPAMEAHSLRASRPPPPGSGEADRATTKRFLLLHRDFYAADTEVQPGAFAV
jgi:hypothetical protein